MPDPAKRPVWRLSVCHNLRQWPLAACIWIHDALRTAAHLAHLLSTLFKPLFAFE